jgi:hypothetical protein
MKVNREKSGIIGLRGYLGGLTNFCGFPIVTAYKYLGYHLSNSGGVDKHMEEVAKKCNYIRWKLTGLRKIGNLKLNINLFRVLIMPLYRLASACFHRLSTAAKAKAEVKIRVQFKLFCNLPVNLSDVTFRKLFGGSVGDILLQTNKKIVRNLQERTRQRLATRANEAEATQAAGQHSINAADVRRNET